MRKTKLAIWANVVLRGELVAILRDCFPKLVTHTYFGYTNASVFTTLRAKFSALGQQLLLTYDQLATLPYVPSKDKVRPWSNAIYWNSVELFPRVVGLKSRRGTE
jgi:hypothetical protein